MNDHWIGVVGAAAAAGDIHTKSKTTCTVSPCEHWQCVSRCHFWTRFSLVDVPSVSSNWHGELICGGIAPEHRIVCTMSNRFMISDHVQFPLSTWRRQGWDNWTFPVAERWTFKYIHVRTHVRVCSPHPNHSDSWQQRVNSTDINVLCALTLRITAFAQNDDYTCLNNI